MKVMFLDESGGHNLSVVEKDYPVFVLGGVIMDKHYAETELVQRMDEFKKALFGRTDIILHTSDITRNRNGFERLKETEFRKCCYIELNHLMRQAEYKVVACVIKKEAHLARHGIAAVDPYLLSLRLLIEWFCFEVGNVEAGGMVVAEKRGQPLDHELEIAWLEMKISGTQHMPAKDIQKRIIGLNLRSKSDNISGLQLADLIVSPIGRMILGKSLKEDFRIIESKLRRDPNGSYDGYVLVVLPKEEGSTPATQSPTHGIRM